MTTLGTPPVVSRGVEGDLSPPLSETREEGAERTEDGTQTVKGHRHPPPTPSLSFC